MSSSFLDLMLKVKVEQQQNETHCERDPLDLYVDGGVDGEENGNENVIEGAVDNVVINQQEEEEVVEERIEQEQQQEEEEEEQQQLDSIVNQEEEEEEDAHYDESGEPAYSPQPTDCVRKRVGRPPKNSFRVHSNNIQPERDSYSQVQMPYLSAEEDDYQLMDDDVDDMGDEIDAENSFDAASFNGHEMPSSTTANGWATAEYSSDRYISKRGYTSQKTYHCGWPGCNKTYKFMGSLTLHRRSHQRGGTVMSHVAMMRKPWQSPGRKRGHWRKKGSKHFKCRFSRCSERFSLIQEMREHMDLVHGGWHQKSFACSQCGRLYMHIKRLRAHQLVCTSTSLGDEVGFATALSTPLTTVSSSFARPPRPPPHKSSLTKQTFSCQNCQKVYKQVKRLRRHQLICFNNDIPGATYTPNTSNTTTITSPDDDGSAQPLKTGGVMQTAPWTTGGKMRGARGGPRKICTKCGKKFKQFWRLKKHEGGCDGVLNIPLVSGADTVPISDGTPPVYSYVLKQNQNTKACEKCGKFYIQDWRQKRHEMLCLYGITVPSNNSLNTSGTEFGLASSSELSLTSQPENAFSEATTNSSSGNVAQLQVNSENAVSSHPILTPIVATPTLRSRIHSAQINTTTATSTPTTEQKAVVPNVEVAGDPQVMAVVKQKGKWTYLIRTTSADGKEESVAFLTSAKARFSYSHSLINFFEKNRLWKCPSGAL